MPACYSISHLRVSQLLVAVNFSIPLYSKIPQNRVYTFCFLSFSFSSEPPQVTSSPFNPREKLLSGSSVISALKSNDLILFDLPTWVGITETLAPLPSWDTPLPVLRLLFWSLLRCPCRLLSSMCPSEWPLCVRVLQGSVLGSIFFPKRSVIIIPTPSGDHLVLHCPWPLLGVRLRILVIFNAFCNQLTAPWAVSPPTHTTVIHYFFKSVKTVIWYTETKVTADVGLFLLLFSWWS